MLLATLKVLARAAGGFLVSAIAFPVILYLSYFLGIVGWGREAALVGVWCVAALLGGSVAAWRAPRPVLNAIFVGIALMLGAFVGRSLLADGPAPAPGPMLYWVYACLVPASIAGGLLVTSGPSRAVAKFSESTSVVADG